MTKNILIVILLVTGAVILSGCAGADKKTADNDAGIKNPGIKISEFESTQGLKKFSSAEEIREFLKANAVQEGMRGYGVERVAINDGAVPVVVPSSAPVGMPVPAPAATAAEIPASADYSKTNIQVEGVDEADFVKNDGRYVYVLAQNKLVIVDAFPAEKAKVLSETKIPGRPRNLFINEDRLIVFTENEYQALYYPEYEYMPVQRYTQNTSALVYDISNRTRPEQVANYDINGNYFQSRMIDDDVYFIAKDNVYYYADVVDVPVIRGAGKILAPDVYYFDNPEQDYVFHTIASLNIKSLELEAKSFMMGYSDNLYVSGNNIYITYRKNLPLRYYQAQQEERFYKVVVPQLPEDAQNKINEIKESKLGSYEKWNNISSILEETYNRMDEKEKQDYLSKVEKAVEEYEVRLAQETEKTVIQKIGISKGEIEYKTKGEVPGTLLNQFSMDEYGEYFRVATTSQFWTRSKSVQFNNVYVLDESLGIVGKLEEIAPDERIYSTRFIDSRLYMVTFRRTDPLFVIGLSDPKKPEILGELKIPGFSDYLHPYDENHIIGVGKETGDNSWGGVSIKGVKLSLFDVSDVNNPKQLDKYEIGGSGTDSEALRDHKAFLFDRKKNLLVIPIREQVEDRLDRGYSEKIWQGAYVFGVALGEGFKLKGKISHLYVNKGYGEQYSYWDSPAAVRRSLYIDDVLYTISARKILMNELGNLTQVNSVELPFVENQYYDYGWR